jgi:hypothetical protein
MKKLFAGFILVACVFIASSAIAAGVKVPKTLCLYETSYGWSFQLVIKSQGSMPTANGTVISYSITGHRSSTSTSFPISGSAYVAPGSTILHANFDGQYDGGNRSFSSSELFYNLVTNTGTLQWRFDYASGNINHGSSTVNFIDCKDPSLTIPSSVNGQNTNASMDPAFEN